MTEEFRPVKGFEDEFTVSNFGRVWGIKKKQILNQSPSTAGYKRVWLNGKHYYVHRLVAEAFCKKPEHYDGKRLVVNHKDENPSNNHANNLEWVTDSENITYNNAIQRRREKNSVCRYYQFDLDGNLINVWFTPLEINDVSDMKIVCQNIYRAIKDPKGRTAYGYHWGRLPVDRADAAIRNIDDFLRAANQGKSLKSY